MEYISQKYESIILKNWILVMTIPKTLAQIQVPLLPFSSQLLILNLLRASGLRGFLEFCLSWVSSVAPLAVALHPDTLVNVTS